MDFRASPRPRAKRLGRHAAAALGSFAIVVLGLRCGGASDPDLFSGGGNASSSEGGAGQDSSAAADAGGGQDASGQDVVTPSRVSCPPAAAGCAIPQQVCCARETEAVCTSPADCQDLDVEMAIPCDEASDCETLGDPGYVCCGIIDPGSGAIAQVRCLPPNSCRRRQGRTPLCNPNDSAACNDNRVCGMSGALLPGYNVCLNN